MRYEIESSSYESDRMASEAEKNENIALERRIRDAQSVSDRSSGIRDVELDSINTTDIQSSADFSNPEQHAALRREAGMLKQMQPALEQGADVETFHDWDKANQIGHYSPDRYVRGYADVYHSYHGPEAIAIEQRPDGTYDVLNGRHRLAVAHEVGLKRIPAKIVS